VASAYQKLNAADRPEIWITLRPEAEVAAEVAAVDPDAPLAGKLFAVKDNIDVAGLPTTAAHPGYSYLPAGSATAVTRLQEAGAVVVGKTNLDQFATGLVGTRSPYGAVRAAHNPELVSGGSSSGSAVATALGFVDFALGTDTAGSGRVPAAFNRIIGVKPTLGLVSAAGVVPACRSYDTISVFGADLGGAYAPLQVVCDASARPWPADAPLAAPALPTLAVPNSGGLAALSAVARRCFEEFLARISGLATIAEIDLTGYLECGRILYDGGLVAERYQAFGEFLLSHPDGADPTVRAIVEKAARVSGHQLAEAQARVGELRAEIWANLGGYTALLVPTTLSQPTFAQVASDPIQVNSGLGTYTNAVNLADLCAVAIPAGQADGGNFGVSLVGRAFHDQVLADLAARILGEPTPPALSDALPLVVFGAHMRGLELNWQLEALGARYIGEVRTAAGYRMVDLPGAVPRPGIFVASDGGSIAGEEWLLSPAGLGRFTAGLALPMTLGPVRLDDGRLITGFQCGDPSGPDITDYCDWRSYRNRAGASVGVR
jgi:allophanate hydrolase